MIYNIPSPTVYIQLSYPKMFGISVPNQASLPQRSKKRFRSSLQNLIPPIQIRFTPKNQPTIPAKRNQINNNESSSFLASRLPTKGRRAASKKLGFDMPTSRSVSTRKTKFILRNSNQFQRSRPGPSSRRQWITIQVCCFPIYHI